MSSAMATPIGTGSDVESIPDCIDLRSTPTRRPDVSVVVITHESIDDIDACLDSLRALPDRLAWETIVVDNASVDGTADRVALRHPGVRLVRQTRRHGFSANANTAAARATGRHLFFLNPDTVAFPGVLEGLADHLDRHSDVGVAGPRLLYENGTYQPSARRFPDLVTTLVRRTPLRLLLPDSQLERRHLMLDEPEPDRPRDVDWMLGAALAVRREAFIELGGFDEGYRLYCEDLDLCWRLHERGWRVTYVPHVTVQHRLGEFTRRRFLTVRTIWHFRSMLRFVVQHGLPGRRREAGHDVLTAV